MTELAFEAILDPPEPEAVFARLAHFPYSVWLDSAADVDGTGRWSFVAADPFSVLRFDGALTTWTTAEGTDVLDESPFVALDGILRRFRTIERSPIPFGGGAAGFISYEAAGVFERLPEPRRLPGGLPVVHLAFFDVVIGWDHLTRECHVVSTGRPAEGVEGAIRARERLVETRDWLAGGAAPDTWPVLPDAPGDREDAHPSASPPPFEPAARSVGGHPWLSSTAGESDYVEAVDRVIEAIRDGDVYQVNLSQRFTASTTAAPTDLYARLRRRSPAPYGACMRAGRSTVMSTSPERFLTVRDGLVETRPIKGTRPRGLDPESDARMADELLASEKDRAENLMIVDLLRNDLSRVCLPGTIDVPQLFGLESWATVHHLVSVVRGQLRPDTSASELLRATFPCGSVTGAPKIRAMEMIAAAEPVPRGPYCGALGYFAFDGRIDLSVAIRILTLYEGGRADFHAGGGIVYDSVPLEEYRETLTKAAAIIGALEPRP